MPFISKSMLREQRLEMSSPMPMLRVTKVKESKMETTFLFNQRSKFKEEQRSRNERVKQWFKERIKVNSKKSQWSKIEYSSLPLLSMTIDQRVRSKVKERFSPVSMVKDIINGK